MKTIESSKEFLLAVDQMRYDQKRYFCTKSQDALVAAKQLEAAVDECLARNQVKWSLPTHPEIKYVPQPKKEGSENQGGNDDRGN
jgi:hypothetical protein